METIVVFVAAVVAPLVGHLNWRVFLRYLERAAERGDLAAAAKAAARFPKRDHGLSALAKALRGRKPPD